MPETESDPQEESIHDHAWALAHLLLDLIGDDSRSDHQQQPQQQQQQRERFATFYNASRAMLESYCCQQQRRLLGICPSKN